MSHGRDTSPKPYGVAAEFDSPDALLKAAKDASDKGYTRMEGYSPLPVHGLTDIIGFKDNKLHWVVVFMGIVGASAGLGLQYWASTTAYPHNVGGKPFASFPMFVPVTFECMVLFSALTAAGAMIAFNGLPKVAKYAEGSKRSARESRAASRWTQPRLSQGGPLIRAYQAALP